MVNARVRVRHARPLSLLVTALTGALLAIGLLPSVATATSFAARASVAGGPQYVGDSTGTTFTFTVENTGWPTKIGAVRIARPFAAWTVTACPGAPAGWTATRSTSSCIFSSPSGPSGDVGPGHTATFMVTATTVPEATDISGRWKVVVSRTSSFADPSNVRQAGAMGTGLKTEAYSFQILSAVVSAVPATPGAACPAASTSAPAASTGHVIVICGRNRSTAAHKPNGAHSSLGGTFIASHGAFSSRPVAPSTTSHVLGDWSNVTITSSSGSGKTIVAEIGRLSEHSPETTLTGFTALNSPPTVTTSAGSTAYTENDPPTAIDAALTVSDPDDSSLVAAKVRISAGFVSASDTLGFVNQNGITGSYNSATGVLTLSGSASVPDYQAALRSVTYQNSSDTPTPNRTIAFSASDVHAFGSEATKSIAITAVDDSPVAVPDSATVAEDSGASAIDVRANDTDVDGGPKTVISVSDPPNGTTSITGGGTGVDYTPDANYCGGDTFSYTLNGGSSALVTVTVTCVNDAPTSTAPATRTTAEDTTAAFTGGNTLSVGDVDNPSLTVALSVTHGTLTMSTLTGLSFSVGTGTADSAMTFSGSQADLNAALATLSFAPTADYNGAASLSFSVDDGTAPAVLKSVAITITAVADIVDDSVATNEDTPITFNAITGANGGSADNFEGSPAVTSVTQGVHGGVTFAADGTLTYTPDANFNGPDSFTYTVTSGGVTETGTVTVTVDAVNDAPVLAPTDTPLAYTDGDGAVAIDPGISASDVDSANLAGATISITTGYNAAEDTLAFADTATITVLSNTGGVLTLTGTDTVAHYQAALRSVTYANSATHVSPVQRVVTFQVTDSSAATSNLATRTIDIAPQNAAPVAVDQGPVTVAEDGSVSITLTGTDADDNNLTFAIVGDPTKGSLGAIGLPDCTTVLDTCTASVLYTTTANLNGADSFTFKVNDGTVDSANGTVSISITPVNDAPVLDASKSPTLDTVDEDPGAPGVGSGTLVSDLVDFAGGGGLDNVTDVDSGAQLGIAITSVDGFDELARDSIGSSYYSLDGGFTWTSMSSLADTSALLLAADSDNRIYFEPAADLNGTFIAALNFRAWDRTSGNDGDIVDTSSNGGSTAFSTASDTADLSVNPVNDRPDIYRLPSLTTNEDTPFIFGISNSPSVSDVDAGSGQIQMSVSVSHGTLSLSGTSGLSFTFSDANGVGAGDGTADAAMTFRGTLADINAALSGLVYTPGADYNGSDTLSYVVNDLGNTGSGGPLTVSVSTAITVTPVNDPPTLQNIESTAIGYTENDPATAITSTTAVADVDSTDFNTGTLTVNYTAGGAAEDRLEITNQGTGPGQIGVSGSNVTFGGTTFGTFTGGSGTTALVVTFNSAAATPTAVQALVRDVTYRNVSDNPSTATRTVRFVLTDGDGGTSLPATRDITVTAVNDAPSVTVPLAQTTAEDTAKTFSSGNSNLISVGDVDAGASSVQVALSVSHGTVTLSGTSGLSFSFSDANGTSTGDGTADALMRFRGTLSSVNAALNGLVYTPGANFNDSRGSESLSVSVNDLGNTGTGGALSDSDSVGISVTAVADAPTAAAAAFTVETNMKITGLTLPLGSASDPDTGDSGYTAVFTVHDVLEDTCSGGTISNLNTATGTFDFDPPAGQTTSCNLKYRVDDSGTPGALTSSYASVVLTFTGPVIWFVDDSAAVGGTGTLSKPFQTIGAADAVDGANHRIFVFSGTYTQGITLNTGEWLTGQGAVDATSFDHLMGITPPAGTISRPSVNGTAPALGGSGVALGSGNNLQGLAFSATSSTAIRASASVGTLTIADVSINNTTIGGISLTGGGTVTATGTNSITTTTGTALDVENTTIGSGGITFRSIFSGTAASGPTNGIDLNATGSSGGLTVTGTGSAGSGGTIQKTTGSGISLTSVGGSASLTDMNISNTAGDGITAATVHNFSCTLCNITNPGSSASKHGLRLTELSGAASLTNVTVTGATQDASYLQNASATLTSFTVTGGSFGSSNNAFGTAGSGMEVLAVTTGVITSATVSGTTFANNFSSGLQSFAQDTATIGDITVSGSTFTNNGNAAVDFDAGTGSPSMKFHFLNNLTITGNGGPVINVFTSSTGTGGLIQGRIDGNHVGTTGVTDSGSTGGEGIRVFLQGVPGDITIVNNVIRETACSRGIGVSTLGPQSSGGTNRVSDIVIIGNDVNNFSSDCSFPFADIYLAADDQAGTTTTLRAEVHGNKIKTVTAAGTGSYDWPTFDGNAPWLYFDRVNSLGAGTPEPNSTAQLVDFDGLHPSDANAEIAATQTSGTATANAAVTVIAGPITVVP